MFGRLLSLSSSVHPLIPVPVIMAPIYMYFWSHFKVNSIVHVKMINLVLSCGGGARDSRDSRMNRQVVPVPGDLQSSMETSEHGLGTQVGSKCWSSQRRLPGGSVS